MREESLGRIILIEDDKDVRTTLACYLRLEGYEALEAKNGLEGYQMILESPPDVIISDMEMPLWNGQRLLRELQREPRTALIPVIFLTAWSDRASMRGSMELGAADYITKPFEVAELKRALEVQLAKERERREREQRTSEEAKLALVRKLPHELLTPLNGILGPAELLAAGRVFHANEVVEMGHMVLVSAKRLRRSMENLLLFIAYCQLPGGRERPGDEETTFPRQTLAEYLSDEPEKAARVQVKGEIGRIKVSRENFVIVAGELLDNAFKFSPKNSSVEVTLKEEIAGTSLTVKDWGRGMTPEQIATVAPFVQHDRKIHEQQGLGLGLTVARAVLENHGGTLTLSSMPGGPTEATAFFPAGPQAGGKEGQGEVPKLTPVL